MSRLPEPSFRRAEVARILGVTPATVRNRERAARYPEARRDRTNNWRVYSLSDVVNLQLLTFRSVDPRPIAEVLFEKGYRDPATVGRLIRREIDRRARA